MPAARRAAMSPTSARKSASPRSCAAVLADFGRIDFLVNNAGGQFMSSLEKISANGWDAVVRTNLTGGFLMARETYTQWMKQHGGAIVNMIADMWNGMPNMGHSGAARAGMLNFTETAALEWAPVRVNAVAPGWIASSGLDQYPPERREHIRALPQKVPLGRLGTESEISAAIVFLLSPAAAFISGSCIRIDGAVPNAKPNYTLPPRGTTAGVRRISSGGEAKGAGVALARHRIQDRCERRCVPTQSPAHARA